MSRSPYDRWHRPEGYHKSIAAGVPSRLSKGALARLEQHFSNKQERELERELEAHRPAPLRLPPRSASTTVSIPSYAHLPPAFRPAGSGFFRLGHSIWEMRADSDDGYRLVRKHEERAVDMRDEPRTASKKGIQLGDTALLKTAQGIQPVVILALPGANGLASIMDMMGGLFKAPSESLFVDDRPVELDEEECYIDEEECYDDMGDNMLMSPMSGYVDIDLPSIMGDEVELEAIDSGELDELFEEDEEEEEDDEEDEEEEEEDDFESIISILEGFDDEEDEEEEEENEDEGHEREARRIVFTASFNRREAARSIGPGELLDMLRGESQFAIISGNTGSTRTTQKRQTKDLLEDIKDFEDDSGGPKYSDSQIYTVRGKWGIPAAKLERKKEQEFSSGARRKDKWYQTTEEAFGDPFEREKSFLIEGMDFKDAIELAKKHKQEAFIFKSADGVVGMYYTKVPEGSEPYVQLAADPERGGPLLGEESTKIQHRRDPKPSGALHPEDIDKPYARFDLIDPETNAPVPYDRGAVEGGEEPMDPLDVENYLTTESVGVPGFEVIEEEGPYGSPRYFYMGKELRPVGSEPRFFKDLDWREPGRFSRRPESDLWSSGRSMSFGIEFDFGKKHPWDPESGKPYSADDAVEAYGGSAAGGPPTSPRGPKRKRKKEPDYLKSTPKVPIQRFPREEPRPEEPEEEVEDLLGDVYDRILDAPR